MPAHAQAVLACDHCAAEPHSNLRCCAGSAARARRGAEHLELCPCRPGMEVTELSRPAQPLEATEAVPGSVRDAVVKARTSWLKNTEVVDILENWGRYKLRVNSLAPRKPAGEAPARGRAGAGRRGAERAPVRPKTARRLSPPHARKFWSVPCSTLYPSRAAVGFEGWRQPAPGERPTSNGPGRMRPAGGLLFLVNRKECRFFRKDGHNWRWVPPARCAALRCARCSPGMPRGRHEGVLCPAVPKHVSHCLEVMGAGLAPAHPVESTGGSFGAASGPVRAWQGLAEQGAGPCVTVVQEEGRQQDHPRDAREAQRCGAHSASAPWLTREGSGAVA